MVGKTSAENSCNKPKIHDKAMKCRPGKRIFFLVTSDLSTMKRMVANDAQVNISLNGNALSLLQPPKASCLPHLTASFVPRHIILHIVVFLTADGLPGVCHVANGSPISKFPLSNAGFVSKN